jgi:hypothetical protein
VIRHVSSSVSVFTHPWKHRCRNTICFPRSRNVSYQIQKHLMFPKCDFCCGNIVSYKCLSTLENMAKHWQETMFPSLLRAVDLVYIIFLKERCVLFSCQSCFILFIYTRYPANQTLTRLYIYIRIKCFFFKFRMNY